MYYPGLIRGSLKLHDASKGEGGSKQIITAQPYCIKNGQKLYIGRRVVKFGEFCVK